MNRKGRCIKRRWRLDAVGLCAASIEAVKLVQLAFPVFASQVALVLMALADTAMAGRVGTVDLAGVAVAQGFSVATFVVQIGFFSGLTPVLARFKGAGSLSQVSCTLYQAMWLGLIWSVLNSTFLAVVSPMLIGKLVRDEMVRTVATDYLRMLAWGVPAHIVYLIMRNVMESLHETRLSMQVSCVGLLLKVPLNAIFMYGYRDVPGLGGPGCGVATTVAYWGMAAVAILFAAKAMRAQGIRWRREECTVSIGVMRELFWLGMPLAMSILSETVFFSVTALMIAPYGATIVAGHEIAYALATPAYLVSTSIGTAVTIRVSEQLGQSYAHGATLTTRVGVALGVMLASVTACVTAFARTSLSAWFTPDLNVRMLASQLLIFCALYQVPDAIQVALGSSLRGYRETAVLFKGALAAQWLLGFPVGYALASYPLLGAHRLLPQGYWIGFLVAITATAVIFGVRLRGHRGALSYESLGRRYGTAADVNQGGSSTMSNDAFNREWIKEMAAQRERIVEGGALEKVQGLLTSVRAHKVPILPIPLSFDSETFERLVSAGRLVLSAQTSILRHLCDMHSRSEVLRLFGVPEATAPFIDWEELFAGHHAISRFDIVPANDRYYFCELNRDSAIGGQEVVDCLEVYAEALGWPLTDGWKSPQAAIVRLLGRVAKRKGLRRVVICDWSSSEGQGAFGFELLQQHLRRELPDLESHLVYETGYPKAWLTGAEGSKTLVYRGFLYQDMQDHGTFFRRLWESSATIINTFETEILANKSWFAMFWDERYRGLLSQSEIEAIERYVPHTVRLSRDNLDSVLQGKSNWVFKGNLSYGGLAVFMGADHTETKLRALIEVRGPEHWIAQQAIAFDGLDLPHDASFEPSRHNVVLGLYLIDGHASGLNVRASRSSKVVNTQGGRAGLTWAVPMTPDDRARRLAQIRSGSSKK